jgi:predicted transcriptional regulator
MKKVFLSVAFVATLVASANAQTKKAAEMSAPSVKPNASTTLQVDPKAPKAAVKGEVKPNASTQIEADVKTKPAPRPKAAVKGDVKSTAVDMSNEVKPTPRPKAPVKGEVKPVDVSEAVAAPAEEIKVKPKKYKSKGRSKSAHYKKHR